MLYGATLAAYVPLSALMPSMAPEHKGAAMSALNLGAGASTFVGPAIVGIFIGSLGVVGVMWIYASLYLFSAILTLAFVRAPEGVVPQKRSWGELGFGAASTLLGHPPAVPNLDKDDDIDMVMVDVGGGVYDDDAFAQALLRAARELAGGELDEREFWKIYDAQQVGIRTIWLLRGEAPPAPTIDQLGEPDAVITSMTGLPIALARVARTRAEASAVSPDRVPAPAY